MWRSACDRSGSVEVLHEETRLLDIQTAAARQCLIHCQPYIMRPFWECTISIMVRAVVCPPTSRRAWTHSARCYGINFFIPWFTYLSWCFIYFKMFTTFDYPYVVEFFAFRRLLNDYWPQHVFSFQLQPVQRPLQLNRSELLVIFEFTYTRDSCQDNSTRLTAQKCFHDF